MSLTNYSVVHFYDDNSVEVVPKCWLFKNGTCAWPKHSKNYHKLIERNSTPNKIEYNFLRARELCSGIDSLIKAREKAKKAMYISDLSDDDKTTRKYKYIKKPYSPMSDSCPVYSDSEENSRIIQDDVSVKVTPKNNDYVDGRELLSPSPKKIKSINTKLNGWSPSSNKTIASTLTNQLVKPNSSQGKQNSPEVVRKLSYNDSTVLKNYKEKTETENTPDYSIKRNTSTSSKYFSNESQDSINDKSSQKLLKTILKNIVYLQTDVKHIEFKQNEILKKIEEIESKNGDSLNHIAGNDFDEIQGCFPIESLQSLDIFEEKINENSNFRKYLIQNLSYLGGNSLNSTMKRILVKLFTDHVLSFFSYNGKKGKKKFCELNICLVIFDAVKSQYKFMNVSQNELEGRIKYHLAQAPFNVKKNEKQVICMD